MIKAGQQEIERAKEENTKLLKRRGSAMNEIPKHEATLNRLKNEYKGLKEQNRILEKGS